MVSGCGSEVHRSSLSRRRLLFWGLVIAGGVLRLVGLGTKCLWVDEINALFVSEDLGRIFEYCRGGHEPPLRYLAIWLLQRASNPDFAVRLPAAVFGALSVGLMFHVGEKIRDRRVGTVAALFLMLSPWHLYHSQDARYYAVMLFLALAGLALAFEAAARPMRRWLWAALAGVCVLDLYISYVAIFAVVPLFGYLAWVAWKERQRDPAGEAAKSFGRGMAIAALVGLICLAPWLPRMVGLIGRYVGEAGTAAQIESSGAAHQSARRVLGWHTTYDWAYADDYLKKLGVEQPVLKSALLLFFLVGLVGAVRRDRSLGVLAALWFVFPWAVILTTGMRSFCPPRYLIHYLGLYLLFAASGAVATFDWFKGAVLAGPPSPSGPGRAARFLFYAQVGVIVAAAFAIYLREDVRYFRSEKQNWRAVVRFLDKYVGPTEAVLTGAFWTDRGLRHYRGELSKPLNLFIHCVQVEQIESQLAVFPRVWYVTWGPVPPELRPFLAKRFDLVHTFHGLQGDIFVYRSRDRREKADG